VTTLGVKWMLSIRSRAGSVTLVTGIDVFPFASLIWPSGPAVVVVVGVEVDVVVVVVLVDVDVDVLVEFEVELLVESVELEPVVTVVVESASGLSGPAAPALAK
jgi:hypothetical protein